MLDIANLDPLVILNGQERALPCILSEELIFIFSEDYVRWLAVENQPYIYGYPLTADNRGYTPMWHMLNTNSTKLT